MTEPKLNVVTGAFGYVGNYVAQALIKKGERVRTLTGHPDRQNPFGDKIEVVPFHFHDPGQLVRDLEGVDTVYNTYWVRLTHGHASYGQAVANVQNLIRAAREAGVRRFVHVSITKPSLDSPYPYFKGKAVMEETLKRSGLSHAIVRPTVIFGREDILINNIAYLLRTMPVFGIFGGGDYRLQPVLVSDVAELMVDLGGRDDNVTVDAVGPETYSYLELVKLIKDKTGGKARIMKIPPVAALAAGWAMGWWLRDVVINLDEIGGLMDELLVSEDPPTCPTRFSRWLGENIHLLGTCWSNELDRHYRDGKPWCPPGVNPRK